jgi:amidophosphoribosyltransferase
MKSRDQFIANFYSVEEIRNIIGADSLAYISIEGLVEALGMPEEDLCLACVNNKYPTRIAGEKYRFE